MEYDDLVKYIRCEGCRVYVYRNKNVIYGGSRGTFDYNDKGPIICVATSGVEPERCVETLLHEFGHFLQWRDGFMQALDGICDAYTIEEKWINHKIELNKKEFSVVRNTILAMEYDAEKRGYKQGCLLSPKHFNGDFYLRGAAAYMDSIKWSLKRRIGTSDVPCRSSYDARLLSYDELFEKLNDKKLAELDKELRESEGPLKP